MSAIRASLQKRVLAASLAMPRSAGKSSNNFANRKLSPFLSLGEHLVKLIGHFVSVSANSCQIECFENDLFFILPVWTWWFTWCTPPGLQIGQISPEKFTIMSSIMWVHLFTPKSWQQYDERWRGIMLLGQPPQDWTARHYRRWKGSRPSDRSAPFCPPWRPTTEQWTCSETSPAVCSSSSPAPRRSDRGWDPWPSPPLLRVVDFLNDRRSSILVVSVKTGNNALDQVWSLVCPHWKLQLINVPVCPNFRRIWLFQSKIFEYYFHFCNIFGDQLS